MCNVNVFDIYYTIVKIKIQQNSKIKKLSPSKYCITLAFLDKFHSKFAGAKNKSFLTNKTSLFSFWTYLKPFSFIYHITCSNFILATFSEESQTKNV